MTFPSAEIAAFFSLPLLSPFPPFSSFLFFSFLFFPFFYCRGYAAPRPAALVYFYPRLIRERVIRAPLGRIDLAILYNL
jgi:hypothetical protein